MEIDEQGFLNFLSIKKGAARNTILGHKSRLHIFKRWLRQNSFPLDRTSVEQFLAEKSQTVGINEYIYFFRSLEAYLEDIGHPQTLIKSHIFRHPAVRV